MKLSRLAFLGSTNGSTLSALLPALQQQPFQLAVGVTNKKNCGFGQRLQQFAIPLHFLPVAQRCRKSYDQALTKLLTVYRPDLILMIGYMRIAGPEFVRHWHGKLVNIHPSLLPRHQGLMDLAVHQRVIDAGENETGCTIHLVEEQVDGGKILLQRRCQVEQSDSAATLKERVQQLEIAAWLELLERYARERQL